MNSADVKAANHLGGTVYGPAVQVGSVDVLNIHMPDLTADAMRIPQQLPPVTRAFTGRVDDRERLSLVLADAHGAGDHVATGPMVVCLHSAAGMGKPALAVRWLLDIGKRFPDEMLYARFDASSPVQTRRPGSIPIGFPLALGVAQHALPADPEHCAALYRTLTAHRALTIAACAAAAAIRPGLPLAELADDLVHPQDTLNRNGDILVHHAVQADYDGLHPLGQALFRLIGAQPVSRLSFRMLTALLPPGGDGMFPAGTEAADYQLELDPGASRSRRDSRVQQLIDELTRANLLAGHPLDSPSQGAATDPTGMSGPVWTIEAVPHKVARELADMLDLSEVRSAAVVRVVDQVLWPALYAADTLVAPYRRRMPSLTLPETLAGVGEVAFTDCGQALAWLDLHIDTIAAYVRALYDEGEYQWVLLLVDALWPLCLHRKHNMLRLELDALALRAAKEVHDQAAQAEMFTRVGLAQTSVRAFDEAVEALKAALGLRLRLRDQWGEADCRNALGLYHQAVGNIEHASTQFRLAATGYQAVGALREQALTNHNLGALYLDASQYNLALVQLTRTLEEFAGLPQPDEYNALRTMFGLARAHLGLRQYRQARDLAVQAGNGLARLGNVVEHARALEVLADIAHATSDPSYPHRLAEALALHESVGSPHADRLRERLAAASGTNHSTGGDQDAQQP